MLRYILSILCLLQLSPLSPATTLTTKKNMVVTEQYIASNIGEKILQAGGNAIDAAVAVGYALAVVDPCCGNIGGGGFMMLHLADGKNIFINFRERAPLAANSTLFLNSQGQVIPDKSTTGYLAVAVPGTVLGLDTALKKYGSLSRQQVMAPAIALAEKGFLLSDTDAKILAENSGNFKKYPNVAAIFLKNGKPNQAGDTLVQKNLANTLKLIAEKGPDIFYKGKIAETIVQASKANGGVLSQKDFAEYYIEELSPISCTYRGYTIISAPPPSSGGITLCEMLNILEGYPLYTFGFHSAESIHAIVEAMHYSFIDRNTLLGDPDFVNNPTEKLISKKYANQIREKITKHKSSIGEVIHEGVNTTHYSIVDQFGNAVAVTYTLNSYFGAQVIAGNTGFFLNNEMDDFSIKPGIANKFGLVQGANNAIQPGKRPLSSMSPTLIFKNNKIVMVLGSPGGPRIITSILQTILNVIDYNMNIQDAVNAARFHYQWLPDTIYIEPNAFNDETTKQLIKMGYHITPNDHWSAVEAIYIDPTTHTIYGANDIRRPAGKAAGS